MGQWRVARALVSEIVMRGQKGGCHPLITELTKAAGCQDRYWVLRWVTRERFTALNSQHNGNISPTLGGPVATSGAKWHDLGSDPEDLVAVRAVASCD